MSLITDEHSNDDIIYCVRPMERPWTILISTQIVIRTIYHILSCI